MSEPTSPAWGSITVAEGGTLNIYAAGAEPERSGIDAVEFLSAIDPGELEKAALYREDTEPGEHGLMRAVLATLVEWAAGTERPEP
jgi:hypothetical protein